MSDDRPRDADSAAPPLRRALSLVTIAWVFGALWLYISTGAVITRYAKLVHLPEFGFGLLAAVPFAGSLAQVPASWFLERFGHRKRWFIWLGAGHRLTWLVVAAIPWVVPGAAQWPSFLVVLGVSWVGGAMVTPAWVGWMADLVPARIRGRFFSRRSQLGQFVGLITTIVVGFVLDRAAAAGPAAMARTLSVALAIAAVAGLADFLCFLRVPEVGRRPPDPDTRFWQLVREPLRDRGFRRYLAFNATLTFGIGYVSQFCWLFAYDVLGTTNLQANLMLMVMPMVVQMAAARFWGRAIDRFGRKPVLILAGLWVVPGAMPWVLMTRDPWWIGYGLMILMTMAWPGIELSNFNFLLGLNTAADRRRPGSAYVAVSSTVGALAGVLSGLFGGLVAQTFAGWQASWFGCRWTYHTILFMLSAAIRLCAVGWLFGLEDRGAAPTRAALRYLGTNVYSNLQQTLVVPARLIARAGQWTYKMTPGGRGKKE